ncbi:MAG: histidinol dehydrogenase [Tannerellaceae bacterium]|nr:histidinol dehydrogenase [Tannerellaceae bacterium]
MPVIMRPPREEWGQLAQRPVSDPHALFDVVRPVVEDVERYGDAAILRYEMRFDGAMLESLAVSEAEIEAAGAQLSPVLRQAIISAGNNIYKFHKAQKFEEIRVETSPGVVCRQKAVPLRSVGLYIPGGTAPLFSTALMLATPARIAGCPEIILCTPPQRDGSVHPAILFAAALSGVNNIYKMGGIQAIAAMACGTQTIPKVDKIFGPGNQYVAAAKEFVNLRGTAIDLHAGPSEVEILADDSANPAFVAADMLSQAEHGPDSQAILVTAGGDVIIERVIAELSEQLEALPRKETARKAIGNSRIIALDNMSEAIDFTNLYAPEHLIIQTRDYRAAGEQILNAGSIFLGHYTPESAGDYASGANHTLPTNGHARTCSGVNFDSFVRKITLQEITQEGLRILADVINPMSTAEQLDAHRNAVTIRTNML